MASCPGCTPLEWMCNEYSFAALLKPGLYSMRSSRTLALLDLSHSYTWYWKPSCAQETKKKKRKLSLSLFPPESKFMWYNESAHLHISSHSMLNTALRFNINTRDRAATNGVKEALLLLIFYSRQNRQQCMTDPDNAHTAFLMSKVRECVKSTSRQTSWVYGEPWRSNEVNYNVSSLMNMQSRTWCQYYSRIYYLF